MSEQIEATVARVQKRFEPYYVIGGMIVSLLLGGIAVYAHVQNSARTAVLDEAFLAKLAASVRPTCVFTSREVMETQIGTDDYIEGINVVPMPHAFGYEIRVKMKRKLHYPPLVVGANTDLFPSSIELVGLHDWKFTLTPETTISGILLDGGATLNTNVIHRFKLEILH